MKHDTRNTIGVEKRTQVVQDVLVHAGACLGGGTGMERNGVGRNTACRGVRKTATVRCGTEQHEVKHFVAKSCSRLRVNL